MWSKNIAFTLAEVLITLGIIGVVAALTIPGLLTEYQKKATSTKLQRAISVINQAYKSSFDDLGDADVKSIFDMGPEEYVKTYWEPYIKISTLCLDYKTCGYSSLAPLKNPDGSPNTSNIIVKRSRIGLLTMDGFLYIIFTSAWNGDDKDFTSPSNYIWLDLNGSERPNKVGHDVFMLTRIQDKGVVPMGYRQSQQEINKNCSKKGSGYYCAEKIKRAGWKIEKDYPF